MPRSDIEAAGLNIGSLGVVCDYDCIILKIPVKVESEKAASWQQVINTTPRSCIEAEGLNIGSLGVVCDYDCIILKIPVKVESVKAASWQQVIYLTTSP